MIRCDQLRLLVRLGSHVLVSEWMHHWQQRCDIVIFYKVFYNHAQDTEREPGPARRSILALASALAATLIYLSVILHHVLDIN